MPVDFGAGGSSYAVGTDQLGGDPLGDPIVRLWMGRQTRSQELRDIHQGKWRAYWAWYRSHVTPIKDRAQWWRSNEYIPTPFKIVETVLPRYLLGMFEDPDWFSVTARHQRNEEYEDLCKRLLQVKLEQMELFPEMYDAIKYATIMGHAWGKVTWEEEWMQRKTMQPTETLDELTGEMVQGVEMKTIKEKVFGGPRFGWCALDKVWPDPSGRERWYIEQIDTTLEELEETQRYLSIYDKEAFGLLKESLRSGQDSQSPYDPLGSARQGSAYGHSIDTDRDIQVLEGIPWSTVAPQSDGVGVTLLQCWGWVPPHLRPTDGSEWRLIVIANGQFKLRDDDSPTPDSKPPYFPIRSIRIPGRLYGESILYYVGPMADQQTRLANMRIDEVFLGIWQSMLIKQGSLASDNQMYFKPGGYMEVKTEPGQPIKDVVDIMPRAPLLPQVWQEDMYRQTQAEHAAAASDIMQGVSGGVEQTATEVERKLQQGNARHVLQTMLFGYDVQKELLERTWEWLRMRMTDEEKIRMGEEYATLDLRHIQVPIDISIGGGFFAMSKQQRVQRSQTLVTLLQNPFFAQIAKPIPIFDQALTDLGYKNVPRFMMTQQEFEEQQQRAQVQQLLQGSMEGAEGPAGQGSPPAMPNMPGGGQQAGMGGSSLEGVGMESDPLQ